MEGLQGVMTIPSLIYSVFGVFAGIIFGAIPGLAANIGIVLFLPLTYVLEPVPALLMLLGIFCGATYGGSVTAILLGTPGTNSNAMTVLDGYPMTKAGKPWKALMAALVASVIGGVLSALLLLVAAPVISRVTIKFAPPELFTVSLFGLAVIAAVSGGNIWKGLASGVLGMLLATVGMDTMSGKTRFIFGNIRLSSGLSMSAMLLGVFAMVVILDKVREVITGKEAKIDKMQFVHQEKLKAKEVGRMTPLSLKATLIGSVIGIIPGVGAGIAGIMSYNEAKRASKHPEQFGQGCLEGIWAPECANNAVTGSALIPTLTLGVPGAPAAATLMAAFTIHGLQPGPLLFRNSGTQMYSIMIGLVLLNLIMLLCGWLVCKFFVNVVRVPGKVLVPILTLTCVAGAYAESGSMIQVYTLLAFGLLGYVFTALQMPTVPLVLGFILGPLAEQNFRKALVMSRQNFSIFVQRPICVVFLVLTVIFVIALTVDKEKIKKLFRRKAK